MSGSSRIPGFYKLPPNERRDAIEAHADLETDEVAALDGRALSMENADLMVENVIGTFALPLGVGLNLLINGRDVVVPMAVEEPSVVAAVSNMAKLVRTAGGFTTEVDDSLMIGQVQLIDVAEPERVARRIEAQLSTLVAKAAEVHPRLVERGGGLRDMYVRTITYDEPGEDVEHMVVPEFVLDCVDAMGANMVNTVAERIAPDLAQISGETVGLRILSNLASQRLARAFCAIPAEANYPTGSHLPCWISFPSPSGVCDLPPDRSTAKQWLFATFGPKRPQHDPKGDPNMIRIQMLPWFRCSPRD